MFMFQTVDKVGAGAKLRHQLSDCRQSPRFTPGLFFCSYQHSNDSSGFRYKKITLLINSKVKRYTPCTWYNYPIRRFRL